MPEGPEIHRAADAIRNALIGRNITKAGFYLPEISHFGDVITGSTVNSVEAKGKAMLIGFDAGLTMYSHNQLYGKWYITPAGSYPKTGRQLRAELHTGESSALLYSASDIEVLDEEGLSNQAYLKNIGPDLLRGITPAEVTERCMEKPFRNRSFGALLLDQHFLSGSGNYLRSEILFDSQISPWLRPSDCTEDQLEAFGKSAVFLTRRSYETGGITTDEEYVRLGKAKGWPRKKYRHYVFAKEGEACPYTNSVIEKTTISSRRLFFSREHQNVSPDHV